MEAVTYVTLTVENFNSGSLDYFIRRQEVKECWRRVGGKLVLLPVSYTEDWDLQERRKMAAAIREGLQNGCTAYGALHEGKLVGFAVLGQALFGKNRQYIDLAEFYVSEPLRGKGIGRALFGMACEGAVRAGAGKLYISAHSARESMAVYWKLGCVEAEEINQRLAEKEPCDVQMEYVVE